MRIYARKYKNCNKIVTLYFQPLSNPYFFGLLPFLIIRGS